MQALCTDEAAGYLEEKIITNKILYFVATSIQFTISLASWQAILKDVRGNFYTFI